jgi:hypothetical protein
LVAQERFVSRKAVQCFDELCKRAGARTHRTVDKPEGLMLLMVRSQLGWKHYIDPPLPGGGKVGEAREYESSVSWKGDVTGYGLGGRLDCYPACAHRASRLSIC